MAQEVERAQAELQRLQLEDTFSRQARFYVPSPTKEALAAAENRLRVALEAQASTLPDTSVDDAAGSPSVEEAGKASEVKGEPGAATAATSRQDAEEWANCLATQPSPVTSLPGVGRTVPGETIHDEHVGASIPKIDLLHPAESGWREAVEAHVRASVAQLYAQTIRSLPSLSVPDAAAATEGLARETAKRTATALKLLERWPRGDGPGELLHEPVGVGATEVEHRGVSTEWWVAVASRAPFVVTRVLVEAFIKPVTREAGCALWYFVPERFRAPPAVFISHAWSGSAWDIRPPATAATMWLDVLAVNQHPATDLGEHSTAGLAYTDVPRIGKAVAGIARTCVVVPGDRPLLPFSRSWCLYEIAETPPGALELRIGWGVWSRAEQEMLVRSVEALDVTAAATSSPTDKEMIDQLVLDRFGTAAAATAAIKGAISRGFAEESRRAFVPADEEGGDARRAEIQAGGGRAHADPEIVALWAQGETER